MNTSRFVTGGIGIVLGVFLMIFSFFSSWVIFVYGLVVFAVGLIIMFNDEEDQIEKIKKAKNNE